MKMQMLNWTQSKSFAMLGALLLCAAPATHAADENAARALARQSNCFKCHALDKKKEGPSFKDTAAKYSGKAGAQERLYKHLTSGEKVKFEDGHMEDHTIVKTKDDKEIKNLVDWILAQK